MGHADRRKYSSPLLKMDFRATWFTLILAVITFATTASSSEPRVVCYYTNWSVYRPGTARFNPQNINPYLCTHLVYAFGGFTKDNALKPFDKYQDIEKGGYAKFTGLKTYNKNLKTMLAIGGWNEGSTRFSPMVASRERRKEFVKNAIKFLRQNRFDGLDLDWEYPAFRDGGKPKDREHYAKLVKELREEFERESEKTGRPRLLLTMAVPAGIEYIQKGFDVKTLNKYLDWMNLLTYDYHSAFEPAVNHHAPLYPLEEPNEYSVDNELNIDYTIKFYLENGADPDKLVLGIPTYGRSYTLFNADATEIGAPADGPGEQGDATREKGYLAYYEICEALKPKKSKRSTDSEEDSEEDEEDDEDDQPWTVVYPNPNAMGPVAYKGNQWVGYDDMDIVRKKSEYVAENGLGGIMFWSIDNDDFRGNCHGKPYPLIEAAKEAYINKLGSTDNTVTDASRALSSAGNKRRNRPRTTSTTAKPAAAKAQSNKRNKPTSSLSTTTPSWNIVTPEPPTTPDPGTDFKCTDEGFFPHPRDCKKYFWCLDSGPSNLGIVAHHFTCPSGLFFNKAADSCDFARNVLCKKPAETTKAPPKETKAPPKETTTKAPTTTTIRRPVKLSTKSSVLFRSTTTTTTTTTPEPEEEEYDEEEEVSDTADIDAEDPKVIKELIDLIKKVGGVEQLEKHLHLAETSLSPEAAATTTPTPFNKKLYQKVLERTRANKLSFGNSIGEIATPGNSRRGPQNAGIEASAGADKYLNKDRPKYTTINRSRGSSTAAPDSLEEDAVPEPPQLLARARAVEASGTSAKPLQYVNIRRARPATSDTADDTASRNALFERSESYATVTDNSAKSLDIASARRENVPEYVTIRRQRPSTEEPTSALPPASEEEEEEEEEVESLESVEREISSPPSTSNQPQYTSILRTRSTTLPPPEPSSPEPTTVLAVQISTLINNPVEEAPENTVEAETQTEATEAPTTTASTTTTTVAPTTAASTRRPAIRRRGSTTTTTQGPTSSTTQSSLVSRRKNFLRRTKSTSAPDVTESIQSEAVETTTAPTAKYTRRGISKFKTSPKKEIPVKLDKEVKTAGNATERPSLNGGRLRSEPRVFVRRRGANATTTTPRSASPTTRQPRPFRVASRRRPLSSTSTSAPITSTTAPSTSASSQPPTIDTTIASDESLQDVEERDSIEDPSLKPRNSPPKKTIKIQRRPLTSLRELDQNPAATNEEGKGQTTDDTSKEVEGKRQSKKYSASFKQNQLNEVLRQKTKDQEIDTVTDGITIVDDLSPETAVAIAAHQLLAAPLPSFPDYDTKTKSYATTKEYRETDFNTATTPIYKSTSFVPRTFSSDLPKVSQSTSGASYLPTTNLPKTKSSFSIGLTNNGFTVQQTYGPSTARYGGTDKYISVPIEEFGYSTDSYVGGLSQEPTYFTREYLLESPVTRTYDDEYQYLSPITTPSTTTTRKTLPKKTVYRKISTTIRPTLPPSLPPLPVTRPKPRRTQVKPFEKVKKTEPARTYRPIVDYDYYDDSQEKVAGKYEEGTKVIVHGKGTIECLDIGNFPHPSSCKKFISCARMESGGIIGWEYICPQGLSYDPVGGICNWSAGLGCHEN